MQCVRQARLPTNIVNRYTANARLKTEMFRPVSPNHRAGRAPEHTQEPTEMDGRTIRSLQFICTDRGPVLALSIDTGREVVVEELSIGSVALPDLAASLEGVLDHIRELIARERDMAPRLAAETLAGHAPELSVDEPLLEASDAHTPNNCRASA
jgi:hypothetical protein